MKSLYLQPPRLMASNISNLTNNACRILLFVISFIFCFSFSLKSQLQVNSSGYVSIQNSANIIGSLGVGSEIETSFLRVSGSTDGPPISYFVGYAPPGSWHLYSNGRAHFSEVVEGSDLLYKKNIIELDGSQILTRLLNINGHKYEFKSVSELEPLYSDGTLNSINDSVLIIPNFPAGQHYGLIAQEVEKEFPELVSTDPITNARGISYSRMIPVLLEAIKEQQAIINSHEVRIGKLESKLEVISNENELKSTFDYHAETDPADDDILQNTTLYQNSPNPFNQVTTIRFVISEKVNQATLYIYNMQGVQIQSQQINDRGYSALEIQGAVLKPGMYLYTLIADGRAIDTKRMILTD
jgi:hypothetical protein